jgi:hypothetical protein
MKSVSNINPIIIYMNITAEKVLIVNLLVSKGKTLNTNILQMLNKSFSNTNFNTNFIYKIIRQLNVY